MPTTYDEPRIPHGRDKSLVVEANELAHPGQLVKNADNGANLEAPSEQNEVRTATVNNAIARRTERLT